MDFDQYQRNQQLLSQITRHTTSSAKALETKIAQWNISTEKEIESDLDLIHSILKHGRACASSFTCACAAQRVYPELAQLVIKQTKSTTLSYSLLVCMVDLVKSYSLFSLSKSQSISFITIACTLWLHHKIYVCRKSMEVCYRLLSHPQVAIDDNEIKMVIGKAISYIRQCRVHMTRADIETIRSSDYTEFYFNDHDALSMMYDRSTIRWLIQIIFALFLKQTGDYQGLIKEITNLYESNHLYDFKELLFDICCVNDDDTVQFLNVVLSIYQQQHPDERIASFLSSIEIDPHSVFLFFVQRCGNTHDILIDLLLENDSEFISYFRRYIIYATQHIESFKRANSDLGNDMDTIQTIVANTLLVLGGDGFPYNAKPLIRRLILFEEKLFAE